MKRTIVAALAVLLAGGIAVATDPLAKRAAFPQPVNPPPSPTAVLTVKSDHLYVFERDVDCSVKVFPKGAVTFRKDVGPVTVRGVFADGVTGKAETRTFKGPFVYSIEDITAEGPVHIEVIPYGFKSDSEATETDIVVSTGLDAKRCPNPKPAPDPKPKPDPTPTPVTAKQILVVFIDRTSPDPAYTQALSSTTFRTALTAAGWEMEQVDTGSDSGKARLAAFTAILKKSGKDVPAPGIVSMDLEGTDRGTIRFVGPLQKTGADLASTITIIKGGK